MEQPEIALMIAQHGGNYDQDSDHPPSTIRRQPFGVVQHITASGVARNRG